MSQSTQPDNTVLALAPPIVNGRTVPVEGAMIGLSIVAYDLVTDGEGAIVFADPPLSGTMDPNDVMELWLEAESAVLDSETIVDPDKRTTLRIPRGRLHPDRINELYYTVRRGSDNIGTSTTLTIHYNRIRPGLKDRYDAPGGHSELELLLPEVIKNGVGPDFVSAEVCVQYPYCRAHDVITLKCNGEFLEPKPRVLPTQAPLFPGSEVPIKICFTVTRAFLDKAKRQDKKLHFSYTVTDQIGNGPDTDAPWSPVQTVNEDLDGALLPKLILLEREEDYPGDVAEIIDLEKLGNNNLLLVVLTTDNRFVVGYDVIATYTATNTGQPADVVVTVRGKVTADRFGVKQTLFLEVLNDRVFANSSVTVTYELRKPDDDLVGSSNTAIATVTGSAPIELLPPFLVDAVEPIDVLAYPNGVKIRIEYPDARKDDRPRLVEVNPPAGSPQFPLVEFNSDKQVDTVLSPAFLAARQGKVIEFRWNLNRNGGQAGKSPIAKFSVLKIADGDARLPTPLLSRASGDNLDVTKLELADTISVDPWPHIPGELISLFLKGEYFDGTEFKSELVKNEPSTPPGFRTLTPFEELKKLKNNSNLNISLSTFADTSGGFITTKFPERNYKIQNTLLEENFDEVPIQSIGYNGTIETPVMTIKVLSHGTTLDIAKLDTLNPPYPKPPAEAGKMYQNVLYIYENFNSTILIKFKTTYSSVSFWYNQTKTSTKVTFFGPNRLILGTQNFKQSEEPSLLDNMTATYSEIIEMEITGLSDTYLLDCFTFKL